MCHSQLLIYFLQDQLHSRMAPHNCLLRDPLWSSHCILAWNFTNLYLRVLLMYFDAAVHCFWLRVWLCYSTEGHWVLPSHGAPGGLAWLDGRCVYMCRLFEGRVVLAGCHGPPALSNDAWIRPGLQGVHPSFFRAVHLSAEKCLLPGVLWLH